MGRYGVEFHEVATVADKLSATGKTPTVEMVRAGLNHRGSNSTLSRHLRQWHVLRKQQPSSSTLPESILSQISSLYESLQHQAQEKYTEFSEKNNQLIGDLNNQIKALRKENEELIQKVEELNELLRQEKETNKNLNKQFQKQEKLNFSIQIKRDILNNRLADKNETIKELKEQVKQLVKYLEHFQEQVRSQREEEKEAFEQQKLLYEQTIQSLNQQLKMVHSKSKEIEISKNKQKAFTKDKA